MSSFKDRALMGIKKTFLLKNKATQYSLPPFVQPLLTSLDAANWLTRILGVFQDGAPTRHSFPDLLNFLRWRSSQISHPGDCCDVKIPTHVRLRKSNSPGLPDPPILGQTIDRCIMLKLKSGGHNSDKISMFLFSWPCFSEIIYLLIPWHRKYNQSEYWKVVEYTVVDIL